MGQRSDVRGIAGSHPSLSADDMQAMQHPQYSSYNGQHPPDGVYRASPQQQHSSVPLLPPIQHFEGQDMQSQPQYAPAPMSNGAQMPQHPPPFNPSQYPYQNGGMQPAPMPSSQNGMMRYQIEPLAYQRGPDGTLPRAARNKTTKDIKRRTKTGCLTCRKRRIKCDEGHPTCRNCVKSKRECLGYDPIFKSQPGPAAIQPAPPAQNPNFTSPNSSNTYKPQSFPGTGGTFVAANNSAQGIDGQYEYSVDPALGSGEQPRAMAANLQSSRRVKPIVMDQLFSLNDVPPRYHEREGPPQDSIPSLQEVGDFYRLHFAYGLDRLFETSWYSQQGSAHLLQDPRLLDFVAQCMEQMKARTDDAATNQALQSLEARLVWQLALMPRSAQSAMGARIDQHTSDVLPRIRTVEHLLTGQFLSPDQAPPQPPQASEYQNNHAKYNELNFWYHLGRFASIRDDNSDPNGLREINDALGAMRGILGMMENRDVLYSLAIARHIGGRLPDFHPGQPIQAPSNDPGDDVNKLKIAYQFVEAEDQKGTTQVIQRVCGMAIRSWTLQK